MMAHGPRQRNRFRRRMKGLTDYRRRLKLLKSRKSRAVVRVSNTRTTCQLVDWSAGGDKVNITQTGGDLVANYGWPENLSQKNIPASYLVGFTMGKAAVAAGHSEAVLDIGLAASSSGSRVFAALKGMVDAGLDIPHSDEIIPSDDRISGSHVNDSLAAAIETTKAKIEEAY